MFFFSCCVAASVTAATVHLGFLGAQTTVDLGNSQAGPQGCLPCRATEKRENGSRVSSILFLDALICLG